MLVSGTPNSKKKRKRSSNTPNTLSIKKKKKTNKSCSVPELILCADELKSEVKHEAKLLDLDVKLKQEENLDYIVPELILNTDISLKSEHPVLKSETLSPVKVKKKKKKKSIVPLDPVKTPDTVKAKKKKKSKVKETVINQNVKPDPGITNISGQFLDNSEISIDLSGLGSQSDYSTTVIRDTTHSDFLVKEEPVTPEKVQVKIEPVEINTLFNSNIKQELECDDAVDVCVSKKLSFHLTDSCIERYQTTLHCAIPPAYINNIQLRKAPPRPLIPPICQPDPIPLDSSTRATPAHSSPKKLLFLSDSIHLNFPTEIFHNPDKLVCVKKEFFQLNSIEMYKSEFAYTDYVFISSGVNDLSCCKWQEGNLFKYVRKKLSLYCRKYPNTIFIFNSLLTTDSSRELLNIEINKLNHDMFLLSLGLSNMWFFDSHHIALTLSTRRGTQIIDSSGDGIHITPNARHEIASVIFRCINYHIRDCKVTDIKHLWPIRVAFRHLASGGRERW